MYVLLVLYILKMVCNLIFL